MNDFGGSGCRNSGNSKGNNFQGIIGYATQKSTRKTKSVKKKNKR